MTIYASETNPFLEKEITFYVMKQPNNNAFPKNYYSNKLESDRCFGSIQKALEACLPIYRYKIIVKPGVYTEDLTLYNKDLSKVTIEGEVNNPSVDFDNWTTSLNRKISVSDLDARFLSVISCKILINNCRLPSIKNMYFKGDYNKNNTISLFNAENNNLESLDIIASTNAPDGVDKSFINISACNLYLNNFILLSNENLQITNRSNVLIERYFQLSSTFLTNIAKYNYSPPLLLKIFDSSFNLTGVNYKYKKIENARIYCAFNSDFNVGEGTELIFDNERFGLNNDNSINYNWSSNPVIRLQDNSKLKSSFTSKIIFKGSNKLINIKNNCSISFFDLEIQTPYVGKGFEALNNSSYTFFEPIELNNTEFTEFLTIVNQCYVDYLASSIKSTGLNWTRNLTFYAIENSYIMFKDKFNLESTTTWKRPFIIFPSLNTGFDQTYSRCFESSNQL